MTANRTDIDWPLLPNPDDAAALLSDVCAPKPFAKPDKLPALAMLLWTRKAFGNKDQSVELPPGSPLVEIEHLQKLLKDWQDRCVDGLNYVEHRLYKFRGSSNLEELLLQQKHISDELELTTELSVALRIYLTGSGVDAPRKRLRLWHAAALALFHSYIDLVGSGSTSRLGPANHFVKLALKKSGWGQRSPAAIEQALNRLSQPQK